MANAHTEFPLFILFHYFHVSFGSDLTISECALHVHVQYVLLFVWFCRIFFRVRVWAFVVSSLMHFWFDSAQFSVSVCLCVWVSLEMRWAQNIWSSCALHSVCRHLMNCYFRDRKRCFCLSHRARDAWKMLTDPWDCASSVHFSCCGSASVWFVCFPFDLSICIECDEFANVNRTKH